ncbi:MAG: hypothetical protein ACKPFK_07575, partial [Dolichospermum sp.]
SVTIQNKGIYNRYPLNPNKPTIDDPKLGLKDWKKDQIAKGYIKILITCFLILFFSIRKYLI